MTTRHPYADHLVLSALERLALVQGREETVRYLLAIRAVDASEQGHLLMPERIRYPRPGELPWPHLRTTQRQLERVLGCTLVSSGAP